MKKWAVLQHGRFDGRGDPNSVIERMGRDLAGAGYDVTTLDVEEHFPERVATEWQPGDTLVGGAYSNGVDTFLSAAKNLEDQTLVTFDRVVFFDPVVKSMLGQIFHQQLVVPLNIKECVVYLRGHQQDYPNGRTRINGQLTIVPMLTSSVWDHGRIIEVAAPEALALLQGSPIPDLSAPVPGQETVA